MTQVSNTPVTGIETNVPTTKPASPWMLAFRQFRKNKLAVAGLIALILMFLVCFIGPFFSPYDLKTYSGAKRFSPPSSEHWMGTDMLGRDIFLRVMLAGRISLLVGLAAMVVSVTIGSVLGAVAGYYRGWVDTLVMRIADIMMSIPTLPILIILGSILSNTEMQPSDRIYFIMFLIGFLSWPGLARLVRGQILALREQEFMQAAEALGLSDSRKIFKHLLPNTVPIIIVVATLSVAGAIMSESVLSYLGVGVIPPTPSWGNMISAANNMIDFQKRPWLWIPPGLFIFITVISINVMGDALRDALDPKMKR